MHSARFGLLVSILLLNVPVWAQQAQTAATPSPAAKDPQAVIIVNQVLGAAGGVAAIKAIADYTASGTITYHEAQDVQGTVTVRGSGLGNLRIDAALPTGIRSEAISNGDGQVKRKAEDGGVTPLHVQAPMAPGRLVLPYLLLAPAVNSPGLSLSYKGLVNVDGHSAHDVQLVRIFPGLSDPTGLILEYGTIDFFIDPSTFQLLMMQDVGRMHQVRQVRYSDYRLVNGVLVPFSITQQGPGPNWRVQFSQITFNAGLQDLDFQL
jgi:hypothetical protein